MASALGGSPNAVHVWEAPVRLWHWLVALSVVVLAVTGYFIGSPSPSVPGEASEDFPMGCIRFARFPAGYVFAVSFVLRAYIAFGGNEYSRGLSALSARLFRPGWCKGLIDPVQSYAFVQEKRHDRARLSCHP